MALDRLSYTAGYTALAGGGQTGATELRAQAINVIETVATAGDSTLLPQAVPGTVCVATNLAAANSANVFPRGGEQINNGAADAALALAAGKTAIFTCGKSGRWGAVLSA